jgi:hypothetical protein
MRERHIERESAAEGKPDERGPFDAGRIEHPNQVVDRRKLDSGRLASAPEAQVVADRPEARGERVRLRLPQARVAETAVHEQHRGTVTLLLDPQRAPFTSAYAMRPTIACGAWRSSMS